MCLSPTLESEIETLKLRDLSIHIVTLRSKPKAQIIEEGERENLGF
jgi:hypothetical protein